ncbi:MAG: hypothetical protein KDK70_06650 [Myxococcales bacterium]|nr:hypothetical protein [Myxococcales bacterium]
MATVSLAGCDVENDLDRSVDDFELEDDDEATLPQVQPDGLDLVASAPSSLAATNIWAFDDIVGLNSIGDGDAVMLRSYTDGYLGCDASGVVELQGIVTNTDGFVWKVHRPDLDGDGTNELQFELIDATGETGQYLKMNDEGEVFCGSITGIGDAAAWRSSSTYYVSTGSFYRKIVINLRNYKQDLCIGISGGAGSGAACTGVPARTFRVENLTG